MTIENVLSHLASLMLLLLERTGVSDRLSLLPLPLAVALRPAGLLVLLAVTLALLFGMLASGPDTRVRAFRSLCWITAPSILMGAFRFLSGRGCLIFLGATILVSFFLACGHRALATRRRTGSAARAIAKSHRVIETLGLLLLAIGAVLVLAGRIVPLPLAFWSLFLLQLSIAHRIGPSRLAEQTGLKKSARKNLEGAMKTPRARARKASAARNASFEFLPSRIGHLFRGIGKFLLIGVWLLLPLGAALAHREVARGEWPASAIVLTFYPAVALAVAALLLFAESVALFARRRLAALRGIVLSLAALLYLYEIYRNPAFAAYRGAVPGAYLAGTLLAFLLRAAAIRNRRPA